MSEMDDLAEILTLEPIEVNLFRGRSPPRTLERIYGGQVVAQALAAAYQSVEDRICHSLQCYFIRPGDPKQPVLYQVERSRDGGSFSTRRVLAIQKGEQIFNMACSFQKPEQGFDHQSTMPDVPGPAEVTPELERFKASIPPGHQWLTLLERRPIEIRPIDPVSVEAPEPAPAEQKVWFRARATLSDDIALNQIALAYASDYALLTTGMRPHAVSLFANVQTASLDHAVWFHRPSNLADWHLYVMDSPSASGARSFNRGLIYRHDGVLVASTVQEGLMRQR